MYADDTVVYFTNLCTSEIAGLVKGFCLVYDHASSWKRLDRYTLHSYSHYLTMLMLRGGKSQRGVAKSYNAYKTAQLELY